MSTSFVLDFNASRLENIFTDIGKYAEQIFGAYAGGLVQTYLYCYALYIFFISMRILIGQSDMPLGMLFKQIIIGAIIYVVGVQWATLIGPFYDVLSSPLWATTVTNALGITSINTGGESIYKYILLDLGKNINMLWESVIYMKFPTILIGTLCAFIASVFIGFFIAVFTILYFSALFLLALTFGLAPIFIIALFFESTKPFFASWLRAAIGLALIPVGLSIIIGIFYVLISYNLSGIPPTLLKDEIIEGMLYLLMTIIWIVLTLAILRAIPDFITQLVGAPSISQMSNGVGSIGKTAYGQARNAFANNRAARDRRLQNKSARSNIEANKSRKEFYDKANNKMESAKERTN